MCSIYDLRFDAHIEREGINVLKRSLLQNINAYIVALTAQNRNATFIAARLSISPSTLILIKQAYVQSVSLDTLLRIHYRTSLPVRIDIDACGNTMASSEAITEDGQLSQDWLH